MKKEVDILVREPPKLTMPPLEMLCSIEKKEVNLSAFQEFLFEWFGYLPSNLKDYIKKRALELDKSTVYVSKRRNRGKTVLKLYFSDERLFEPDYTIQYTYFQRKDLF